MSTRRASNNNPQDNHRAGGDWARRRNPARERSRDRRPRSSSRSTIIGAIGVELFETEGRGCSPTNSPRGVRQFRPLDDGRRNPLPVRGPYLKYTTALIAGWPLPVPVRTADVVMENLIGHEGRPRDSPRRQPRRRGRTPPPPHTHPPPPPAAAPRPAAPPLLRQGRGARRPQGMGHVKTASGLR